MKVKVIVKVVADGNEVAKEKVVSDVESLSEGDILVQRVHETVNQMAHVLRRQAGV